MVRKPKSTRESLARERVEKRGKELKANMEKYEKISTPEHIEKLRNLSADQLIETMHEKMNNLKLDILEKKFLAHSVLNQTKAQEACLEKPAHYKKNQEFTRASNALDHSLTEIKSKAYRQGFLKRTPKEKEQLRKDAESLCYSSLLLHETVKWMPSEERERVIRKLYED